MSSTWNQKQEAVRVAITKCLRLDSVSPVLLGDGTYDRGNQVEWENKREASRATQDYWCDLRLGSVLTLGQDEKRRVFVDNGSVLTSGMQTTYGGQRIFNVMCIVGSDNQDADKAAIGELGSLIRTRLRREDILEGLQAVDISINRIYTTLNVDYEDDGVMYSQSMTEIRFNTTEEDLPEAEVVTSYIAEVHGTGVAGEDLEDVDLDVGPVL